MTYEELIEIYIWLQDPLRTSSTVGTGGNEWADSVCDICYLKELVEDELAKITNLI